MKIYRKKKYCERKLNLIETYIKLKIVLCCWKINVRGNYLISNFILSTNFTKYVELKSNQPPTTTSPPTCSKILNQPKHDSAISMPFIFFQTKELILSSRFSTLNQFCLIWQPVLFGPPSGRVLWPYDDVTERIKVNIPATSWQTLTRANQEGEGDTIKCW